MMTFLRKTAAFLGDSSIQIVLKEGEFAETIIRHASDINADLIVMGSHSKGWLRNMVIGSITENVLRHSTLPLLVIPTKN
jgi:nucleotide-binding universal stress UspA family protein